MEAAAAQRPTPGAASGGRDTDFMGWLEGMRVEHDLSWAEVSRRSGVSENGLRKIRQGETTPRPATMEALASAFTAEPEGEAISRLEGMLAEFKAPSSSGSLRPLPAVAARRGDGDPTTYLTVGVRGARGQRLDRETAGRLILFLEAAGRAWLATADCTEND